MKRFLVLQSVVLEQTMNGNSELFQEPVQDFDTFEEALDWIATQEKPEIYTVEDQFADEFVDEDEDFEDMHDYSYYDLRDDRDDFSDANLDERDYNYYDEGNYSPFDGDGDAD